MIGSKLSPVCVASALSFQDIIEDPPASVTDPVLFRKGSVVYLRDTAGVLWPLIPGANGAGVADVLPAAAAPYVLIAGDSDVRVDTSSAGLSARLPVLADCVNGRRVTFRAMGANALTIDGHGLNVNGSPTATIPANTSLTIEFVAAFGAVSAQWVN